MYAYARCPLINNGKSLKMLFGCILFLVVNLLDTIYLFIDLFSNGISLIYSFSSMYAKTGVGIYARCCLHYIFIDQSKG